MWAAVDEKVHHSDAHLAPQAGPHHSTLTRGRLRWHFSQMLMLLSGAEPEEASVADNEEADDAKSRSNTSLELCLASLFLSPLQKKASYILIKTEMSLGAMDCPPSKLNKVGREKENTPLDGAWGVLQKSLKFLLAPLITREEEEPSGI